MYSWHALGSIYELSDHTVKLFLFFLSWTQDKFYQQDFYSLFTLWSLFAKVSQNVWKHVILNVFKIMPIAVDAGDNILDKSRLI